MPEAPSEPPDRCPRCGAPFSPAPGGDPCARCLLALGLDADAAPPAGAGAGAGAAPVTAAEPPEKVVR
jgi:hypothetical protein